MNYEVLCILTIYLFYFSIFYGLIIGRNRENLKNLEYQTRTRIKIPGMRENNVISKLVFLKKRIYDINY